MKYLHEKESTFDKADITAPDTSKGRIHSLMADYDRMNYHDRENMNRLGRLIMRIEGPTPEEWVKEDSREARESQSLLDGVELLNEKHACYTEAIAMMISKLEELI